MADRTDFLLRFPVPRSDGLVPVDAEPEMAGILDVGAGAPCSSSGSLGRFLFGRIDMIFFGHDLGRLLTMDRLFEIRRGGPPPVTKSASIRQITARRGFLKVRTATRTTLLFYLSNLSQTT